MPNAGRRSCVVVDEPAEQPVCEGCSGSPGPPVATDMGPNQGCGTSVPCVLLVHRHHYGRPCTSVSTNDCPSLCSRSWSYKSVKQFGAASSSPARPCPPFASSRLTYGSIRTQLPRHNRLLERDAVIQTGPRGSFIDQDGKKHSKVDLGAEAVSAIARVVAVLRRRGLTDSEIRNSFVNVMRD